VKTIFRFVAWIAVVVAIGNSPPAGAAPTTGDDKEQVIASERAWTQTAVDGDARAMAKFMADDYVEIVMETDTALKTSRWVTTNKADWIDLVHSGREKYKSVELRNLKVYFHADMATVTGEYSQTGTKDGKDISATGLYVDTWVNKSGNWQIVSSVFP
jgi:ketosteroid isomerase-like protein